MDYSLNPRQEMRNRTQDRLETELFDLVVVGGGITGAGVARDAALRGLKTVILDKGDFASGTSSRSTRMVHGGLRYIPQFRLGLVREALRERFILHRIAPHLVRPRRFVFPVSGNIGDALYMEIGLIFYDTLSLSSFMGFHRIVGVKTLGDVLPPSRYERMRGGLTYPDCTVDDARLTLSTILSGVAHGLTALNYSPVMELIKENGRAAGVRAVDAFSGRTYKIRGKAILCAAGPWTNQAALMDDTADPALVRLTKGVHLVIPRDRLPLSQPTVFFAPQDRRGLVIIPWHGYTCLGTTDTDFTEDPDTARVTRADARYLLEAVNHLLPHCTLSLDAVRSGFAGVRPLVHEIGVRETRVSREHRLVRSPSGAYFLYGGKLTTHRSMAQEAVDKVCLDLSLPVSPCRTARVPLDGLRLDEFPHYSERLQAIGRARYGLDPDLVMRLIRNYGARTETVLEYVTADDHTRQPIHPDAPVLWGELDYSVRHEGTVRLTDFMVRRTHLSYTMETYEARVVESVAVRMAALLGWDRVRRDKELELFWTLDRSRREFGP